MNDILFLPIGCTENHGIHANTGLDTFMPVERADSLETNFIHADESETSVAQLMFPEMVDMRVVQDAEGEQFLPEGHFDTSVEPFRRPHRCRKARGILP